MKTRPSKRHGFSLIELLTVLAVLSVVTTIGVTCFIKMTSMWSTTTADMEANVICVRIFDTIRGDTERVVSAQRTGLNIKGIDRLETDEAKALSRFKPEDDRVIVPILEHNVTTGDWRQMAVMYHIDRSVAANPKLVRTLGPNDGSEPSGAATVISERILAMNIAYLNADNTWEQGWAHDGPPQAVRISLSLGLLNRPDKAICREAVFPIHVK